MAKITSSEGLGLANRRFGGSLMKSSFLLLAFFLRYESPEYNPMTFLDKVLSCYSGKFLQNISALTLL